jgi:hypothetical protein
MAADHVCRNVASRAGKSADLARALPIRHEILVELHELDRRCHSLFLVRRSVPSSSRSIRLE